MERFRDDKEEAWDLTFWIIEFHKESVVKGVIGRERPSMSKCEEIGGELEGGMKRGEGEIGSKEDFWVLINPPVESL